MYCTSCGTKVQEGSAHCTSCGAALAQSNPTISSYSSEPGIPQGCLVLFVSIFTMPIKTAQLAGHELRTIAKTGVLSTDSDFPHLSWYKAVLPVIATFCSACVLIFGILSAFGGLVTGYGFEIDDFFGVLIGSILGAIAIDWLIMIFGELLMINVAGGRYYSRRNNAEDKKDKPD